MRHFGRQSTHPSSHVTHSAVHNSEKRNNAQNEAKVSKENVFSSIQSEIDHGTAKKDLLANQSDHFVEDQKRTCILTAQKDGVRPLCISESIDKNQHAKSYNKRPRRRMDRSISTTGVRDNTYANYFSSTNKSYGHKKVYFHLK